MILLYLQENIDKTTKSTTLQEFQSYIVKNIDEFILSTPEHDEF